jgi:hypothetical protein
MSLRAMAWAFEQRIGDPLAKFLLIAIANYADERDEAWPSLSRLAGDTEMGRRSVVTKIEVLVEAGLIARYQSKTEAGDWAHNRYTLLLGGSAPHAPPSAPHALPGGAPHAPGGAPRAHEPSLNNTSRDTHLSPSAGKAQLKLGGPTGLLPDWEPTERDLQWLAATYPRMEIASETAKFRDYYIARGEQRADWSASFRTWCRRARDHQPSNLARPGRAGLSERNHQRVSEMLDELADAKRKTGG